MKDSRYSLRALALLLSYPDQDLRQKVPELIEAIDREAQLPAFRRDELRTLASELLGLDPMAVEVRYVETFDRGRATSLYLGPDELPDHLCVVLEFASTQPPKLAQAFLGEMTHILSAIFSALLQRGSPYAAAVAAVLELAGQRVQAVPIQADEPMDALWAEPQAFDGCSTKGQARPGDPQPIHIVRQQPKAQGAAT